MSYTTSVQRVNKLVRHEQIVNVQEAAQKINQMFFYSRLDLQTMTKLPVIEEFINAKQFKLQVQAQYNKETINSIFNDFLNRMDHYNSIKFISNENTNMVEARKDTECKGCQTIDYTSMIKEMNNMSSGEFYVSKIKKYSPTDRYIIHCASPIISTWKGFSGIVVIDIDFQAITNIVEDIQVGENGYGFLIDQKGRMLVHPDFVPYRFNIENYPSISVKSLIHDMMKKDTGWKNYTYQKRKKVAVFSSVPIVDWSMAVTIANSEYKKEALAIKENITLIVLIVALFAIGMISVLSYWITRPIRRLVVATNQIAAGNLKQEIPVQSKDELGVLTASFNSMAKHLSRVQNELVRSEKLISLGRFSAGVAHEIRNPLNAIKGAIVFLQRRRSEDGLVQEYITLISEEIDRLNRFVSEFLNFAKEKQLNIVRTDLNRLIRNVQHLHSTKAEDHNVRFLNHLDPFLPHVPLDSDQMEQVLVNCLLNAIEAMPKGGEVHFTTTVERDGFLNSQTTIKIIIEDTGIGISPEHLQNIFDPFFSTKETGTGLGMPLSLGIVESHGGSLKVTSDAGEGTRVVIELPFEQASL
ncbi:MAG: ATP-binding protein [Desulfovermiculus sp.]|nr:ATP-binding protein [Desulfovermiculus sp.]